MTRAPGTDEFSVIIGAPVSDTPRVKLPVLTGSRLDDWWQRFMFTVQRRRLYNWGAPAVVVIIAILTRSWNLGHPASLVFDETFYVKDGWSQWNLGYPGSWGTDADKAFNAGDVNAFNTVPSFVVHPPLGKWLIGLGMSLFGPQDATSWRVATVVFGVLAVILLMLIAKKLFNSTLLATIAGLLFAIDGNAIVMSRVALLDNFVMFFALLGFYFVLLDRGWAERRLDRWLVARAIDGRTTDWGPAFWWRPWMMAAAVAFGLTTAVKWNGLYFFAAFAVYTLVVDALARRRAGVHFWFTSTLFKQGPVTFILMVPLALAAYMSTWITWFTSPGSYDRQYADLGDNAWTGPFAWVPHALQSFWHFEISVYNYNIGESRPHPYQANPLTWLFMTRPTSMYYLTTTPDNGCPTAMCGSSISGIANPLIWWAGTAAILYLLYRLLRYREWRVGLILMGILAGYVPWLMYTNRTVFQFYTIAFEPYLILALTCAIGLQLGSRRDARPRRVSGLVITAAFLVLAIALSIFYYPLWTGTQIDYNLMRLHWWLPSWI